MRILILTVGTRGDVQPCVALAKGLVRAGHDVQLCAHARFETFIAEHGVAYAHLNDGLLDFLRSDDGRLAIENTTNLWEAIKTARRVMPKVRHIYDANIRDAWEACLQFEPELIVYHPKLIGSAEFAEALGIPAIMLFYWPMYVPTGDFPVIGFGLPLGRRYNRFTYRLVRIASRLGSKGYVKRWVRTHGLTIPQRNNIVQRSDGSPIPVLHAFSSAVVPRPADWPEHTTAAGYLFLDSDDAWQPSPELAAFLDAGEPPVYVGFGSMSSADPARVTRIVLEAVQRAGVRALLARGWGGLDLSAERVPDGVHVLDAAPHDKLFPRVAAVVHHGGAGTTAAGLRAARPSLICPLTGDQPFWGKRVAALGAGPSPIRQNKLTVEALAAALRQLVHDASMRDAAEHVGASINQEDGVSNAVAFIDRWSGASAS